MTLSAKYFSPLPEATLDNILAFANDGPKKLVFDAKKNAFVEKINSFTQFLEECGLDKKLHISPKPTTKPIIDLSHPLFEKTIVLTGTRDKSILDFLKEVGAVQGSSVSKSTFLLVAKDKDDDTGKAKEARKLNVPVMSIEEFTTVYM
jgi:NAD-dependent DNA ligase